MGRWRAPEKGREGVGRVFRWRRSPGRERPKENGGGGLIIGSQVPSNKLEENPDQSPSNNEENPDHSPYKRCIPNLKIDLNQFNKRVRDQKLTRFIPVTCASSTSRSTRFRSITFLQNIGHLFHSFFPPFNFCKSFVIRQKICVEAIPSGASVDHQRNVRHAVEDVAKLAREGKRVIFEFWFIILVNLKISQKLFLICFC